MVGNRTPAYNMFARVWVMGAGWNINQNLLARIEYHKVDGTIFLSAIDNTDMANFKRKWDMVALQVSYRF